MGLTKPNPLVAITGQIGDLYIAKQGDKYYVKRMPTREPHPATEAQKPGQQNLAAANRYWRSVKTQPELKAVYVLAGRLRSKRAVDVAKSDFMNPPAVTKIDLTGYLGAPAGTIR